MIEAARTHLPEAIELELRAPKRLPQVVADPGQLHQVLVNLVDNAIKYSPEGGDVAVSVANGDGADPLLGRRRRASASRRRSTGGSSRSSIASTRT